MRAVKSVRIVVSAEPEVLRVIGEESRRKGTNTLSSREIDKVIRAARGKTEARMMALRQLLG